MSAVGEVELGVKPEADKGALASVESDLVGKFKAIGDKIGGGLKASLAAGAVGIGGLAAIGTGLYNLGGDFDSVYDGIQTKTGATGKALEDLKSSFRNVAKTVPVDFETAGKAIGDLSSKTGLAGKPLDDLAAKYLNLGNLLDTDVSKSIETNQKLFADFGLTAAESSKGLDKLFSVSQNTGVDMGTLGETMDKFGPQLRGLGLGFNESAELAAKLSQRGVDTSKVLGGLGLIASTSAKDLVNPRERLDDLIKSMQDAPNASAALGEAQTLLGKKVGIEFVDAVRNGKLSMADFTTTLGDGAGAINQTAKDTADGAETMKLAMNRAKLAIEPLAEKAFTLAAQLAEKLAPAIETVAEWLGKNLPPAIATVEQFITTKIVPALKTMGEWFQDHVVPAIRTAVEYVSANWPKVQETIGKVLDGVKQTIETVIGVIKGVWESSHDRISEVATTIWDGIREKIRAVIEAIRGIIDTVTSLIKGDWDGVWNGIKKIADGVWDLIVASIREALKLLREVVDLALDALVRVFQGLGALIVEALKAFPTLLADTGKRLIEGLSDAIHAAWDVLIGWVKTIPKLVADAVGDMWETLRNTGKRLIDGMLDAHKEAFNAVLGFFGGIRQQIAERVGDLWETIRGTGRKLIEGFIDAVKDAWEAAVGWFSGIRAAIANRIGDLIDGISGTGRRLIEGFFDAVKNVWETAAGWFGDIRRLAADKVGDLTEGLKSAGGKLISGLLEGAKEAWNGVVNWLGGLAGAIGGKIRELGDAVGDIFAAALKAPLNAVITVLKNFHIPSWTMPKVHVPGTDIDIGGITIGGQQPFGGLNLLAKGGIGDKPTLAMVFEEGLEAVVPLLPGRVADFRRVVQDPRFEEQLARAFPQSASPGRTIQFNNYAPPVRELDEAEFVRLIRRAEMLAGV